MKTKLTHWFCLALLITCFAVPLYAAEDEEGKVGGVKAFGVIYNMAEDRTVERVGGKYEPEGLDKYMKRKIEAVQADIKVVNDKITAMQKQMAEIKALVQNTQGSSGVLGTTPVQSVRRTR